MRRRAALQLEGLALRSNVWTTVTDVRTGRARRIPQGHNLVVTAGRNLVRDILNGTAAPLSHIALGTSSTAVSAGQTALVAEAYRDLITQALTGTGLLTLKLYVGTLVGNGHTYTEMGVFNDPTAGTMYARALLASPIAKTTSITITAEWDLSFTV